MPQHGTQRQQHQPRSGKKAPPEGFRTDPFALAAYPRYHGEDLLRRDGHFHLLLTVADQGVISIRQAAQAVSSGFTDDIRANVEQMMVPKELEHVQKS